MLVKIDKEEALRMLADEELSGKLYVKKKGDYYRAIRFNWKFKLGVSELGELLGKGLALGIDFNRPEYFYNSEFYKRIDIDAAQKEVQQ